MKLSICKDCKFKERHVWSSYVCPNNYQPIGVSHAYGFCSLCDKRCLRVKKEECHKEVSK